jgi:trehalose-6-phosphatase
MIQIGFGEIHPSQLSEIFMEALSVHVVRHLINQLSQLESGAPNIIALNTGHWSLACIEEDKRWSGKA